MASKDKTAGPMPDAEGEAVPETATIEEWREVRQPQAWEHEAAKAVRNWPMGKMVALSEYDSAIEAAKNIEVC